MVKQYSILILNRYPEIVRNFLKSIYETHKVMPPILVVCDRHQESLPGVAQLYAPPGPFVFSKNVNLGLEALCNQDVILCNDDLECVEIDFFDKLASIAWKFPKAGILSPLIDGGVGNPFQQYPVNKGWNTLPPEICITGKEAGAMPVCFPCVYIRRKMIKEIGPLDETFVDYGDDDNDYCIRARKADWWTMVTNRLRIKHGTGGNSLDRGKNWSVSFAKEPDLQSNHEVFMKKWGKIS